MQKVLSEISGLSEVTEEELNPKLNPDAKYFTLASDTISKAQHYTKLIQSQENESLKCQIQAKQKVVDQCDAENSDLQQ